MTVGAWEQHKEKLKNEYNHPENSPCPTCRGTGHVMETWSSDEWPQGLLTLCPTCGHRVEMESEARRAGGAPRFGDYLDNTPWQRSLHLSAGTFAKHPSGIFYIGGQTATGKSHLCSKIYYHLLENGSSGLNYQEWRTFARRSIRNDTLIDAAKGCNILWLDGFLDVVSGRGTPSDSDLAKALEVINARCTQGKITIISSCWTPERLEDIAPPIASRIHQWSGNGCYFLTVPDGKENRWNQPCSSYTA